MVANQILSSFQNGQKRDSLKDCQAFLKEHNIKYEISYKSPKIANLPTLVPVNHYIRNFLSRKSLFTTIDSIITISLITVGLSKLTKRKTTGVVRDDLSSNFPYKLTKLRRLQLAAIFCYDLIGVSKNYPFSNIEMWEEKAKAGFNIAFFPEGSPSRKLKPTNGNFESFLFKLKNKIPNLQVLPTSVYYYKGIFYVSFHEPMVISADEGGMADIVMSKIAENLPLQLGNNR